MEETHETEPLTRSLAFPLVHLEGYYIWLCWLMRELEEKDYWFGPMIQPLDVPFVSYMKLLKSFKSSEIFFKNYLLIY